MIFSVKNLGPIKEAKIDLSPKLILFTGPNNSGKTYLAFLIYGLIKRVNSITFNESIHIDISKLHSNSRTESQRKLIVPIDFKKLWEYKNAKTNNLKNELGSIFGISKEEAEGLFKDFEIQLEEDQETFERILINLEINISRTIEGTVVLFKKEKGESKISIELSGELKNRFPLNLLLGSFLFNILSFYPFLSASIFPVERNSIYTFSKELSLKRHELIEQIQNLKDYDPVDFIDKRSTRYPLPVRDGLEIAEDLVHTQKTKGEYYDFAIQVERELLHGKMIISKNGEVLFSHEKAKTKKMPIHLTASIVKTLSSLVFYLKHIARKGDVIIIDEPELNLHPENQLILTRIFARLINKGLRLLISTHSDYIIREINNLILLSNRDNEMIKKKREELSYKEDEYIKPEDMNAYAFEYKRSNARKVNVEKIKIDSEGLEIKAMDETIEQLNDTTDELNYALKYYSK